MKIKIDEKGHLWIERKGKMKDQFCPYDSDMSHCGDWCPLFVEPSFHKADDIVSFDNIEVALCGIIYNVPVADFEDER